MEREITYFYLQLLIMWYRHACDVMQVNSCATWFVAHGLLVTSISNVRNELPNYISFKQEIFLGLIFVSSKLKEGDEKSTRTKNSKF